jgi:hypothetical protein
MRWKIRPSGHDPRQIDLLAIVAILIIIVAVYGLVEHLMATPQSTSVFIVPSQNVRW